LDLFTLRLLLVSLFFFLFVMDSVVLQFVTGLCCGNDSQPISELSLLEELLGEVLDVVLWEGSIGSDDNLGLVSCDCDWFSLSRLSVLSLNSESVVEELFLKEG
jgi:hypothetical protein